MGQAKHVRLKNTDAAGHRHALGLTTGADGAVDKDAAVTNLVHGLNLLAAHARLQGLGSAARILATAKEDLVYWAVELNFHESAQEQFINHHLHGASADCAALHSLASAPATSAESLALLQEFNALIDRATTLAMRSHFGDGGCEKNHE